MMYDFPTFLQLQKTSWGALYEPVFSFYTILITSPLWLTYIVLCTFIYLLANKRYQLLPSTSIMLRTLTDTLLNPVLPLVYTLMFTYTFSEHSWIGYLCRQSYENGPLRPLVLSYIIFCLVCQYLWVHLHNQIFKRFSPRTDYLNTFTRPYLSYSRIFGASFLLLLTFDLESTIEHMLWLHVLIGAFFSIASYLSKILYLVMHTRRSNTALV